MRSDVVRLFQTLPHPCGYYADRTAQNVVIDPAAPNLSRIYDSSLQRGFRRAGGHVYYPRCPRCRACIACRVPVDRFTPDRSQRRCAARNDDLALRLVPAGYTDEYFDLYARYLASRHAGGGMDNAAPEDFSRFLHTSWSPTRFLEFRLRGRLLGIAVTDFCANGLSAVYTFFEPDEASRGLGTFAILSQIRIAREQRIPHVYLGFWIEGHRKMDYKMRFRPLEILEDGNWHVLDPSTGTRPEPLSPR